MRELSLTTKISVEFYFAVLKMYISLYFNVLSSGNIHKP